MNAYQEVERLLSEIRVAAHSPAITKATDKLETLCSAYMTPSIEDKWDGIQLTPYESRVMDRLFQRPGKYVSRDSLLNAVYFDHAGEEPDPDIIRVFICKIRKKLTGTKYSIPRPRVYGAGYCGAIAA